MHRCTPILALVALALFAAMARAGETLPEMTPETRGTIRTGRENAASYGDPAFDALLDDVRSWGGLTRRWAANTGLAPDPVAPEVIAGFLAAPDAAAGTGAIILGEFLEREPLAKYANVERWLVAPLDSSNPGAMPDRAAIIFIDRTTSVLLASPAPGSRVTIAARFYKPLVLPARATGVERAYPAFVGAVLSTDSGSGVSISALFPIIGLALALMVAALVVMLVIVSRMRSSSPRIGLSSGVPGGSSPMEDGLPSDPAEALEHLAERARDPRTTEDPPA